MVGANEGSVYLFLQETFIGYDGRTYKRNNNLAISFPFADVYHYLIPWNFKRAPINFTKDITVDII